MSTLRENVFEWYTQCDFNFNFIFQLQITCCLTRMMLYKVRSKCSLKLKLTLFVFYVEIDGEYDNNAQWWWPPGWRRQLNMDILSIFPISAYKIISLWKKSFLIRANAANDHIQFEFNFQFFSTLNYMSFKMNDVFSVCWFHPCVSFLFERQ